MRNATIVLIGCALVSFVIPDTVLGEGAMRLDELKEIVKVVEVEADAWARSSYTSGKVTHRIRNVWYDQGSIGPLRTMLELPRETPNDLFVACRIISPMINAKPAVIAEALGMFHPIAERLAVYKELPTYTEKQLEAMAPAALAALAAAMNGMTRAPRVWSMCPPPARGQLPCAASSGGSSAGW